jgi:hypothetical protein
VLSNLVIKYFIYLQSKSQIDEWLWSVGAQVAPKESVAVKWYYCSDSIGNSTEEKG